MFEQDAKGDPSEARVGHGVIHPTAVIGPGVELGVGVSIGPYAVLVGPTRIGDRVWIGSGASIGAPPEITTLAQNLAWNGDLDHAGVVVHDDAVLRESVVIHQGADRATEVGPGAWLLNRVYLAHDVLVGASSVLSAGVSVGGRCTIRDGVNIGMNTSVHQGRSIGARAMVGMGSTVTGDLPPYAKAYGVPIRVHGINAIGMERAGIGAGSIRLVERAFTDRRIDIDPDDADRRDVDDDVLDEFRWWSQLDPRRPAPFGAER